MRTRGGAECPAGACAGRVAVLAVLALLASGCAQEVPGLGRYSSGRDRGGRRQDRHRGHRQRRDRQARRQRDRGHREVLGRADARGLQRAVRQGQGLLLDRPGRQPGRAVHRQRRRTSAATRSTARPGTSSPGTARASSPSCRSSSATSWSPWCSRTSGGTRSRSAPGCRATSTIVVETQADCYAGAWTGYALKGGAPHFEIGRPVLDQRAVRLPALPRPARVRPGRPAGARQRLRPDLRLPGRLREGRQVLHHVHGQPDLHPDPVQRRRGRGQRGQPARSTRRSTTGTKDLGDYWARSFERTFSQQWKPLAEVETFAESDAPSCDGTKALAVQYCADRRQDLRLDRARCGRCTGRPATSAR